MTGIAVLLDGRAARGALRRSLPRRLPLFACRTEREVEPMLQRRLVDALVLGTWSARRLDLAGLRARYPTIPLILLGPVRAEDGELLAHWMASGIDHVLVEGVDDAVAGELVLRERASQRRVLARAGLPHLLRLTEPLQRKAWDLMAASPGRPPRTSRLARLLRVSREHLSRQFGAGGAPNLKRVGDLLIVQVALELFRNPGYDVRAVARLLGFSGPSHVHTVVRRVTGARLAEAGQLEWPEVIRRFLGRQ